MLKKISQLALIFIVFVSCVENQQCEPESCVSEELLECIKEYIKENECKIAIYDNDYSLIYDIYYYLFFFDKDSSSYFTMWESFVVESPKSTLIDDSMLVDTNFICYNILERSVFIINGTNKKNNILFSYCEENMILAKRKIQNIEEVPIYDGSLYPVTYKYYIKDDNVFIEKNNTTLLHFSTGWSEYEEIQRNIR